MSEPLPVKLFVGATSADPRSKVEIGGVDFTKHVRSIELVAGVPMATALRIEFVNVEVDAEGFVDQTAIGDAYKHYVEAMGNAIKNHMEGTE